MSKRDFAQSALCMLIQHSRRDTGLREPVQQEVGLRQIRRGAEPKHGGWTSAQCPRRRLSEMAAGATRGTSFRWQPGVLPSNELRLGRESPCASRPGR